MKYGLSLSDKIDNSPFIRLFFILLFKLIKLIGKVNLFKKFKSNTVVISFHRLGDSVFTIPALKVLEDKSRCLIIFCFKECIPIYEQGLNNVAIIGFDRNQDFISDKFVGKNIKYQLKNLNPEIIFDLTASILSASLIIGIKAKEIIGANNLMYKSLYDKFCEKRKKPHLMDMYLDIVKLKYDVADDSTLKTFPEMTYDDTIFIQPTAGWPAKEWGLKNYFELGLMLKEKFKCKFIFPENYLKEDIAEYLNENNLDFVITKNIAELLDTLKTGMLYVGNDSGPVHIASMLGLKTLTLFGPTNPVFHVPFGDSHDYIFKTIKCSPGINDKMCFTNGGITGCPSFECMRQIDLKEVYEKVIRLLRNDG